MTVMIVLLAGLMSGMAAPELLRMGTGSYAGFTSMYSFEKYELADPAPLRLFRYIADLRLSTLVFLWMSCYTPAGFWFHLAYGWWLFSSAGLLLALFLLRDGAGGLLLFVCCLFPQWLIYGEVCRRELRFLMTGTGYRKAGRDLASMCVLCFLGCACEAFLGTWTLKFFLQYFT